MRSTGSLHRAALTSIDNRIVNESTGRCFDEGGHESKLHIVTLEKLFGIFLAKLHHVTETTDRMEFCAKPVGDQYLISISLKVVSMAQVFCASLRRSAIFRRIRDIFTLVSERVPVILFGSVPLTFSAPCGSGFCGLAGVTDI